MTILTVVIPAYNEENGIAEIMNRVLAVRSDLKTVGVNQLELIVVDDGSKDKTAVIANQIAANDSDVKVITQKNKGYGGALKTGFSQAAGELIGFLDADGTYPPEYFPALCKEALNGAELVIGSRMAGSDSQMPVTRRIGNFFFANLLSLLGWEKITDSASGMRVFKKDVIQRIYPLPDGLNLTPVMSTRAVYEDINMVEIPIPYSERVGASKLSVVKDGWIFLSSMVWTVLTYNPVRILGAIGVVLFAISLFIFIGLFIARLSGVTQIGAIGVAFLFTALITAVSGISVFSLGATFNYLISIFYKKKIRQGLFGKPIFKQPLELKFGVLGILTLFIGFVIGLISLILSLQGWEIARVWLYLLGSALLSVVGIQLVLYWSLMRVLEEISQRHTVIKKDLEIV
ncbi:MAG: glycosyl transferase [Anaerolineaceae bacterium]|nr:glycosyl transferase [Anaerolineaceae bacterium]